MSSSTPETTLPRLIDPRKFAQKQVVISGSVDLVDLPEVQAQLVDDGTGIVHVELNFGIDEQRTRFLRGNIEAKLPLLCQRCLEAVETQVDCEVNLAIVWDDEGAKQLNKEWDPWIVPEGQADIYQLVQEELILNIPFVNYHQADCIPAENYSSGGPPEVAEQAEGEQSDAQLQNPFQALAGLKSSLAKVDKK